MGHDYVAPPTARGSRTRGSATMEARKSSSRGSTEPGSAGDARSDWRHATRLVAGRDNDRLRGARERGRSELFVLDVASGKSTQIFTDEAAARAAEPSSRLTARRSSTPAAAVGLGALDRAGRRREEHAPDRAGRGRERCGERLAVARRFAGDLPRRRLARIRAGPSGRSFHCGPCRFVANADGTEPRVIPGSVSKPAGTWSPDSTRIVCLGSGISGENRIIVVDVATGDATKSPPKAAARPGSMTTRFSSTSTVARSR